MQVRLFKKYRHKRTGKIIIIPFWDKAKIKRIEQSRMYKELIQL